MADLSRGNQRRQTQDRITENRDAVMPTRNETRVADVQVRADVRAASRGNGQTQAINRFFAQLEGATQAYYQHDLQDRKDKAEIAYSDGVFDASTGAEMDPEQAEGVAYQRAYFGTAAAARQTKFETETQQELARMVESGATVEEIETFTVESTKAFIEETSDLFEQPDVREQVGTRLSRWTNETSGRVSAVIKDKTDRELLDLTTSEIQASLARGDDFDFIATVDSLVAGGLSRDKVQDEIVNSIGAYALRTGDVSVLDRLDDVRRPSDMAEEIELARVNEANAPAELSTEPITEPVSEPAPAPVQSTWVAPVDMSRISSGYGNRKAPLAGASTNHQALDIAVPIGTPVAAPAAGKVTFAGPRGRGGNSVIIEHADGTTTGYAHLDSIDVKVGDQVAQGAIFAKSGNTGNSTGAHLHMTARRNGQRIDPRTIIGTPAPGSSTPTAEVEAVQVSGETTGIRPRAAGASVLTANQQVKLMNWRSQIEGETDRRQERERQEQKEELTIDLWSRAQNGEDVSDIIEANVRTGVLEVGEGMTMTNAFRSLRDSELEGQADEDLVLRYASRFAVAEPNYAGIMAQLDRDYNAGKFGTGRAATREYLALKQRAASGSRSSNSIPPEERRAATVARGYAASSLSYIAGENATPLQRRLQAEAMIEWETKVAGGMAPLAAADAVIADYTPRFNVRQSAPAGTATRPVGQSRPANSGAQSNQTYNYVAGQGMVPTS
ncbi:M23 family metallopeptidase [Brevundimonas sp.]|uniref:M23 family metallopeptidase n=2 Tax=Brevundimonas sp. TaxID=1871086 RepID=UPI002FCC551B